MLANLNTYSVSSTKYKAITCYSKCCQKTILTSNLQSLPIFSTVKINSLKWIFFILSSTSKRSITANHTQTKSRFIPGVNVEAWLVNFSMTQLMSVSSVSLLISYSLYLNHNESYVNPKYLSFSCSL